MALVAIDWAKTFVPDTPLLEIVVRGTAVYLVLFLLLRVVLKRESAGIGVTDLLVVVLLADAAQNAMSGGYQAVPDGLLLVGVIVWWAWLLDRLAFRYEALERLVKPPRLQLVDDGRVLWRNMAKEFVTKEELEAELRAQGIEDLSKVQAAFMETNGEISVLTEDPAEHRPPRRRRRR